jgi:hypothetical protein
MSRAAYYPPANRTAQRFDGAYKGSSMAPNCLVLHTTEGQSWPGYSGGAVAPHLTALPDFANERLVWRQHFPVTMSARALVNRAGGVETNTANCIQVELVGTSGWATTANRHRDYTLADKWCWATHATDWMIRDLGAFIAWCHAEWGVPISAPYAFDTWAGNNSHRMSFAQWRKFKGVCGHSHVPENEHTDPGAIPIAKILAAAKGGATTTSTTSGDDDMQQSDWVRMTALVRNEIAYAHLEGQAQLINNAKAVSVENQKRIEKARAEIENTRTQLHGDIGVVQSQNAQLAARLDALEAKLNGDSQ